ncbi:SlyX family protein [Lysobacter sp. 2RAF19]|jgi:SlyX protein
MTQGDALEARVVELETRIAFLEGALGEMSDALAAARIEASRNAELFRRVLEEMKSSRTSQMADPADEPPPPHY